MIIGDLVAPIPMIQAGMGVQIAKSDLASAISQTGAIGCISSVGLGQHRNALNNYFKESCEQLAYEIRRTRQLAPNGILAVNIMVALKNYDDIVQVCVDEKVDMIISGAGLPLSLPGITKDSNIKLVPVVSSGRSMNVIIKTWKRRYNCIPDAVVLEGPLCGGHLAFSWDQLAHPENVAISMLLREVKDVIAPYEAEFGRKIPIIGAENIATTDDVLAMLNLGFDGVQVGTRFICTEEAGIDIKSKEVYVRAKSSDIAIVQSPLGMPLKVLKTPFSEKILNEEKIKFGCPFLCLRACKAKDARFCIAEALVDTLMGNVDKGLFMVGSSIGRVNDIIPAAEFVEPLRKMVE